MPMQLLRCVGVVVDVYGDLLAFLEAKEWSGEATIVGRRWNDAFGGDLDGGRSNVERVVRRIVSVLWIGRFARQGDDRRLARMSLAERTQAPAPRLMVFRNFLLDSARMPIEFSAEHCGAECTAASQHRCDSSVVGRKFPREAQKRIQERTALCLQAVFPGLGLFVMQGGHGIEAAGAEGGDVAGDVGDEGECGGAKARVSARTLRAPTAASPSPPGEGHFYRDKKGDISKIVDRTTATLLDTHL